jgi:hypothetical protein
MSIIVIDVIGHGANATVMPDIIILNLITRQNRTVMKDQPALMTIPILTELTTLMTTPILTELTALTNIPILIGIAVITITAGLFVLPVQLALPGLQDRRGRVAQKGLGVVRDRPDHPDLQDRRVAA